MLKYITIYDVRYIPNQYISKQIKRKIRFLGVAKFKVEVITK